MPMSGLETIPLHSAPGGRPPRWNKYFLAGLYSQDIGDHMQQPSPRMRELRTALAVALGLAIASFGAAVLAASYIAK
jgi:hypothetical protein